MNSEDLKKQLHALGIRPEDLHIHMDMDGTLYEWRELTVEIPSGFEDMYESERGIYINREVYKQLLTPGYYESLAPYPHMLAFVNVLHDAGVDVRISSCSINSQTDKEKRAALARDLPWLDDAHITLIPDGFGREKARFLPKWNEQPELYRPQALHVLLDDHTANCIAFENELIFNVAEKCPLSASSIKCVNDINHKGGKWRGSVLNHDNADIAILQLLNHIKSLVHVQERGDHDADRSDDGMLQQE